MGGFVALRGAMDHGDPVMAHGPGQAAHDGAVAPSPIRSTPLKGAVYVILSLGAVPDIGSGPVLVRVHSSTLERPW